MPSPPIDPYFLDQSVTFRPVAGSIRGNAGAPRPDYGPPVTVAAAVYPAASNATVMFGLDDLRNTWDIHVAVDPGEDIDEGAEATCGVAPAALTVIGRQRWAADHFVFTVRGVV